MRQLTSKNIILFFLLTGFVLVLSCNETTSDPKGASVAELPDLNEVETIIPEAEGHQTFYNNCQMCHSLRYVFDQPDFPKETWSAIVTKMQKTFGAPVTDAAAEEIVQYLVTVKGKS